VWSFWRYVPGVEVNDFNMYFHTDGETPEKVPWTGLQASTRAYARIIDEVNKLNLRDLRRPPEPPRLYRNEQQNVGGQPRDSVGGVPTVSLATDQIRILILP